MYPRDPSLPTPSMVGGPTGRIGGRARAPVEKVFISGNDDATTLDLSSKGNHVMEIGRSGVCVI